MIDDRKRKLFNLPDPEVHLVSLCARVIDQMRQSKVFVPETMIAALCFQDFPRKAPS
jgi:hypothetical protein